MLPYPRFTKLIMSHYMTTFLEISRRAHDRYHNLKDDVMIKSIFNSGKNKTIVGMKILDWMITEEMKLTKNYQLYDEVFGVDVPTTQSQPTVSTQGTHRKISVPRTPTPVVAEGESSDQRRSMVIRLQQKSCDIDEAIENVEQVKEHLMAEEIEKLVEGSENVAKNVDENIKVSSSPPRNDDIQNVHSTRLEPRSDKESSEVEITVVVTLVNVIYEEEDMAVGRYGYLFEHISVKFMPRRKFDEVRLQEIMMEALPKLVDERIKRILQTRVPLHVAQGLILEREKSQADVEKMIADAIQKERENLRSETSSQFNDAIPNQIFSQDDPHDDAHPEGENSAKRQKTSKHGMIKFGASSSGLVYESKPGPSTSGNQVQTDDFDFWTNSYAIDDDVISNEKVSQEFVDEMSQTVDEAKLRKNG
ncbi:hypothetical protein Tco_0695441 [Tanacetum coccineum]